MKESMRNEHKKMLPAATTAADSNKNNESNFDTIVQEGWVRVNAGYTLVKGRPVSCEKDFKLYVRIQNLDDVLSGGGEKGEKASSESVKQCSKSHEIEVAKSATPPQGSHIGESQKPCKIKGERVCANPDLWQRQKDADTNNTIYTTTNTPATTTEIIEGASGHSHETSNESPETLKNSSETENTSQMPANDASAPVQDKSNVLSKDGKSTDRTGKPSLLNFSSALDIASLKAIRSEQGSLLIGFDSEWISGDSENSVRTAEDMLSWQFALTNGTYLYEFVWIRSEESCASLNLEYALGWILDYLGKYKTTCLSTMTMYEYVTRWDEKKDCPAEVLVTRDFATAWQNARYLYNPDARKFDDILLESTPEYQKENPDPAKKAKFVPTSKRSWNYFRKYYSCKDTRKIPVTIICHAGKADLSALDQSKPGTCNILRHCANVQGGLVTLQPVNIRPRSTTYAEVSGRHSKVYPVILSIADSMCHAPAGKKDLATLGRTIGVPKITLPEEPVDYISHMDQLLKDDPNLYLRYASNDAVIALLYISSIYGINKQVPCTITSAAASVMKGTMMKTINTTNTEEFNRKYRGLMRVSHGLVQRKDRPGFLESTSMEPISYEADQVQRFAAAAYHGGYNSSSEIGLFRDKTTYDFDLENAYPTAMSLVTDVDWEHPIVNTIFNRELTLHDWYNNGTRAYEPLRQMLCYVRFEFPEDVKYPCIMMTQDGVPFYPRTSNGVDGVYACGPELYLAVRLGAKVYCKMGYVLGTLIHMVDGKAQPSQSARDAVYQMVHDRNDAIDMCGKGSVAEQTLKTMANSAGYGKIAQGVVDKRTWSAMRDAMESIGCSAITNPVIAALSTSIVRAVLLAAQNQLDLAGYHSYSVTTDGFITDADFAILRSLDLYGFKEEMKKARIFLTDGYNPSIWQLKHAQNKLLNYTTRGNVALNTSGSLDLCTEDGTPLAGVCAHNSVKSGFTSDSEEDRKWLYKAVLSRTGAVEYSDKQWTTFKDLSRGQGFRVHTVSRSIRMDYDLKRKPVPSSFCPVTETIDGETYEIANFSTMPYEDAEEFRLYRTKKKRVKCLRTMDDWTWFLNKVNGTGSVQKPRDMDWAILMSCITGFRAGKYLIPALSAKRKNGLPYLSGEERNLWINSHNHSLSGRKFTAEDWKNCGRKARWDHLLPLDLVAKQLRELQEDMSWLEIAKRVDEEDSKPKTPEPPRDLEWAILMSCIAGFRAGEYDIPALSTVTEEGFLALSGTKRNAWINSHNTCKSGRKFGSEDWKNCGRTGDRKYNCLPYEVIKNKLKELQEDPKWL